MYACMCMKKYTRVHVHVYALFLNVNSFHSRIRDDKAKMDNFWEDVVPQYTSAQFRRAFRVPRNVFNHVLDEVNEDLTPTHIGGRNALSAEKALAVFLAYAGSHNTILDIGQGLGLTEFSVIKARTGVSTSIIKNLLQQNIRWPTHTESVEIARHVNGMGDAHFPNIVGAIDGSHIPVGTPLVSPDAFYNRKKFHSVNLQGVVNHSCMFTDVSVGAPGMTY